MSVRDCKLRSEEGTVGLGWENTEVTFELGLEGTGRTDRWKQWEQMLWDWKRLLEL